MAKTNWQLNEVVKPSDLNLMGEEINDTKDRATTYLKLNEFTFNDAGTSFPLGLSIMEVSGESQGWPFTFGNGQIWTSRVNNNNIVQVLHETANAAAKERTYFRIFREDYASWSLVTEVADATTVDEKITSATIPDASLTEKGKVMLSNATDSNSESQAATSKAVKVAYDRANEAFTAGNERKSEIVAALVAKGITATINDSWATLVTKIGSMYGKGSVLPINKVTPPLISIRGNVGGFMPAYNSSCVYSITGSVYSKYDLNGNFLYSFGLSGLNDNEYRTRGGLWSTTSDYFFYMTNDSYSGDIRYGYGTDGSGTRPLFSGSVFGQSDGQNSGGGYYGILGVRGSSCFYYDKNSYIHFSDGASTAKRWSISNFSASASFFHPSVNSNYIVCSGRVGGNSRIIVLSAVNGSMITQIPWTHDGGKGAYPDSVYHPSNAYDYNTDHLYVFPANYNTSGYQGYIYKYELNLSTGALTLVKTRNLSDYFINKLWETGTYGYYYFTRVTGILGDDIIIEAFTSNSMDDANRKVVLLNKNLLTEPVYSEYLTRNVSSVSGVQVENGARMITRSGEIINKDLGYTIK